MIKAILFDFGNVICRLDNRIFIDRIAPFSPKSARELEESIYDRSDLPRRYETGQIDSEEFFSGIVKLCGLTIEKQAFIRAYTDIFTPIPETIALIKSLKPYTHLGLISNTSPWDFEYGIKPVEIFGLFEVVTLSFQVKAMKPDRRIFDDALHKLQLGAGDCMFIDDNPEYAAAAGRLGLSGIHYTGPQSLSFLLDAFSKGGHPPVNSGQYPGSK